ncbi:MAG: hypothetical protein FJW34_00760 [Acidobacteria bacterium]|nr:hypothetical protein [Acidobacteriota bacterium]
MLRRTPATDADIDDLEVECGAAEIRRPARYASAQDPAAEVASSPIERWRVCNHGRENPLMFGSHLLVALAIEHALNLTDPLIILRRAVETIGSLYMFSGNHMDGYILRWDPVTSDKWATAEVNGRPDPLYCCEFLLGGNGEYLYCTPFNHPSYVAFDPADPDNDNQTARRRSVEDHRFWEPSMDEIIGLVLSCIAVYELVGDTSLRDEIRRQVTNLGDYLAEHGYLLVRPCGGFTARGASGVLPVVEFPFGHVFDRITGNRFPSRCSFEQAAERAGVWPSLERGVTLWSVGGAVVGAALGAVLGSLAGSLTNITVLANLGSLAGAALGAGAGWVTGRTAGIFVHRDCFDVSNDDARREFAPAYFLKVLPPRQRFEWWMTVLGLGGGLEWFPIVGGYARGFPAALGLAAFFVPGSTVVRDAVLAQRANAQRDPAGELGNMAFSKAVAVVLGARNEEQELRDWLDRSYDWFTSARVGRDLALENVGSLAREDIRNGSGGERGNDPPDALEYLVCLALSWWHVSRQKAGLAAGPVTLFEAPSTTTASTWPAPLVPAGVFSAGVVPALGSPQGTGISTHGPRPPRNVPAFPPDGQPGAEESKKPPDPEPKLPPVTTVNHWMFAVQERDSIVDPNITVHRFDRVQIRAWGSIWAGVWLTGGNGPGGWNNLDNNPKFPKPGGHPYALLYAVVGPGLAPTKHDWRYMGRESGGVVTCGFLWTGSDARLLFRTNDDTPGNGNGQFACEVTVQRA